MNTPEETKGVLFDVDGTLVDSTDQHARAFEDAFSIFEYNVPYHRIRPLIGMGSDKLIPIVLGHPISVSEVTDIGQMKAEIFKNIYFPKVNAFPQATAMLKKLKTHGLKLAVASSASKEELQMLLSIIKAKELFDVVTSADDADRSKPDPDILCAAMEKLELSPKSLWMVGDTPYDIEGAKRAGIRALAFRCSGWPDEGLVDADKILDGPWTLSDTYIEVFGLSSSNGMAQKLTMKGSNHHGRRTKSTREREKSGRPSRQSPDGKPRARSGQSLRFAPGTSASGR